MDDSTGIVGQQEGARSARRVRVKKPDDELKAYRERLTHGTVNKPEFEYELLTMFARNEISAPYAMPALCIILHCLDVLVIAPRSNTLDRHCHYCQGRDAGPVSAAPRSAAR